MTGCIVLILTGCIVLTGYDIDMVLAGFHGIDIDRVYVLTEYERLDHLLATCIVKAVSNS